MSDREFLARTRRRMFFVARKQREDGENLGLFFERCGLNVWVQSSLKEEVYEGGMRCLQGITQGRFRWRRIRIAKDGKKFRIVQKVLGAQLVCAVQNLSARSGRWHNRRESE